MQQIADWLEKLGMSEYAQRFAENDIDFCGSSRSDGSGPERPRRSSLGHRRKLLRAIAALERSHQPRPRSGSARATPIAPKPTAAAPLPSHRGRRRAPLRHGDVLRSGGFDQHFRRGSMPRSGATWSAPISMPLRRR